MTLKEHRLKVISRNYQECICGWHTKDVTDMRFHIVMSNLDVDLGRIQTHNIVGVFGSG